MLKDMTPLLRSIFETAGLDAMVFLDLSNLRYLCGFTGTDGALVLTGERSIFLTDSRYTTQARQQVRAEGVREYSEKIPGIIGFLKECGARRIGFEAETTPFATVGRLKEKGLPDWDWHPLAKELHPLRGTKREDEIEALSEATRISAAAFEEILPLLRPGAVEREVALELEFAMKRLGGEEKAFDFIVASGARGAMPHGIASTKSIEAGDLVTLDFGTRYNGYHSDETVTVAVGEVKPELRKIFDTVLEAHDRAMAEIRPGVSLRDIDATARRYIDSQGYGSYFGHGLGHGVGLEVHEYPTVSPRSEAVAEEGMVFTVEPGIYFPELGGVRIEDMVLVTADGYRQLTRIKKDFRTLPV